MMTFSRAAFKAYDIRGRVPDELNEELAYALGRAYVTMFQAKRVAVGRDIRQSSPGLAASLTKGLTDAGCDVVDIGLCGTEQVYFATFYYKLDGGIMVTASHNPIDYNGLKLVREESRPISADTGLKELEERVVTGQLGELAAQKGTITVQDTTDDYIAHLLSYIDVNKLRPLKVVVNPGNGCAGPAVEALRKHLPFEFVTVNMKPDGTFPNGIPNPILPENQEATAKVVRETGAAVGIAWDGDFDRCFLFDEQGNFIEGYYIVGLLGEAFCRKFQGAKIIHDPRLTWNTMELVKQAGGVPVQCKSGHAFIKQRMREEDAVYGGEMSAHHYFRDFSYCDSGMVPWLLVLEAMCVKNKPLSVLVNERMQKYPCSGEINRQVANAAYVFQAVEQAYLPDHPAVDRTDGMSFEFADWRFNLRSSNTEPVIRLNVEARESEELMRRKTAEILALIEKTSR
jgi:phosphomannomutase/phosphomannomutase/phosphoglucomutase